MLSHKWSRHRCTVAFLFAAVLFLSALDSSPIGASSSAPLPVGNGGADSCGPSFTSSTNATAVVLEPFRFAVTTCGLGSNNPFIRATYGRFGLHFHNNQDGTATISGIPRAQSVGLHTVRLWAFVTGHLVAQQNLSLTVASGAERIPGRPPPQMSIAPPASIPDDCSIDVTTALNSWLASVPPGSTISLPTNGCYLVSNAFPGLTLDATSGLTIDGNGTTFTQTTYDCGTNEVRPILRLTSNTDLSIDAVTLEGPGTCGGASNEGDIGVELGQATPGNTNVTFDHVAIENTDGDALDVYPQLGTCCGINTNVTFKDGSMTHIGYHGIVPEGVNGLTFVGNRLAGVGNFMDLEIDNNYGPPYGCGSATGNAQCNITIDDNVFTDGSNLALVSTSNGTCIPQGNLTVANNTMDVTSSFSMQLSGSEAAACGRDSGLTITNNTSAGPAKAACSSSIIRPPACSMIEISDYANVTISGNQFAAIDGATDYFANTIYVPCITLQGDATVSITHNICNNAWNVWDSTNWAFQETGGFTNSGITVCDNTYWLTWPVAPLTGIPAPPPDPRSDASCSTTG